MNMRQVENILHNKPKGFMVTFYWIKGIVLESDHFPDIHNGEDFIETEDKAWELAERFARATKGKTKYIYVIDHQFRPVPGYEKRQIR